MSPLLAALGGVAAAAACGLVNGVLITRLKVVPFIVTLGTMLIVRGAAKGLADERRIEAPATWLNGLLRTVEARAAWLPRRRLALLVARARGGACCATRVFGRHLFAIGSNERTARLCGVRVERVKIAVYTLSAALAGLAGVLQFSKLSVGDPDRGGRAGARRDRGRRSSAAAASPAARAPCSAPCSARPSCAVLPIGCSQRGLPNWVQQIVTGGIIVLAVALDRWRQKSGA